MSEREGEVWPGPCRECGSSNVVVGEPESAQTPSGMEAMCRSCRTWFDPDEHPAGCFYGSFGGYSDAWHIPAGATCPLPHGDDAIQLLPAREGSA